MVAWFGKLRKSSRPAKNSPLVSRMFRRMDQEMQLKEDMDFDTIQLLRVNRRIFLSGPYPRNRTPHSASGDWRGDLVSVSSRALARDW